MTHSCALCFVGLDEVKSCLNFAQIEKTTSGNIIHDQSLLNNSVEIFSFVALVFCFGNLDPVVQNPPDKSLSSG